MFRGNSMFLGERMQFESHLGHVFSLFEACERLTVYKSPLWALRGWPLLLQGAEHQARTAARASFNPSDPCLCRSRRGHHWSGPRGSPSPVCALRGVARSCSLVQTRTQPMICAGATVGIVHPERDSFAAGVCAIPGFQYLYRIFAQRQCGRMVSRWGTGVCIAVRHIVALRRIPSEGEAYRPRKTSLSASACVPGSQRPEGRQGRRAKARKPKRARQAQRARRLRLYDHAAARPRVPHPCQLSATMPV